MDATDRERPRIGLARIAVWLGCAIDSLHWLNGYAATPGALGVVPESWSAAIDEVLDRRRFTQIVALRRAHDHRGTLLLVEDNSVNQLVAQSMPRALG